MENKKYVLDEYPRPQFAREAWDNLNGIWNFAFDDTNEGETLKWYNEKEFDKKINVPYVYESLASGIHDESHHANVWYQREFLLDSKYDKKSIILNFQGADYITKVWINGTYVGLHKGSSNKFKFDITKYVKFGDVNNLVVKCEDSKSTCHPRGKQRWHDENYACWYVQSTGIWKTVWMEYLNDSNLEMVKITPNIDDATASFEYSLSNFRSDMDLRVVTEISFKGKTISEVSIKPDRSYFKLIVDVTNDSLNDGVHLKFLLWDLQNPNLYDVKFKLYGGEILLDEVGSYFGMRKISIDNGKVLLNNHELYQKLILDQGYWPDTLLTPPSENAILDDIDKTLAMGFNGVRKHMKVEDERYLYWCDQKGVLVWSEFPATYEYNDESIENFIPEWLDVVTQNYNHPSIVAWVPINESWGVPNILVDKKQQNFTEALYYLTKSIDQTRPVIVNDGWEHTISDILTIHDYEELGSVFAIKYVDKDLVVSDKLLNTNKKCNFANGYSYKGQPIIISEYGGIAFKNNVGWGYGNQVKTEEEFLTRYMSITNEIKRLGYACGYCYTQITDVQQEVNGLLNEDRSAKISLPKIKIINDNIII